ncbi:hypothetical protein D4A92_19880 [Rhizobium rosettiformans]|uniref:Transcriptional regulator n=1 Tax=Rhizobium rosettiformans TaxID=1368430 RepID=A0ABX7EZ05_9HYPH|nr:hypothetical protein [Rhizobium rosettiformans]QRF53547.1 hypothetical protein D4A92_19880 [Rhizobium rosettiformans]
MTKIDPCQLDFFHEPLFPVRQAHGRLDLDRYRAQMKRAMARAIRECPYDRPTIAARMAQYLGLGSISKSVIDAYTAESKTGHDITLPRFAAFVHATGAVWLWDEAARMQGVTMLIGEEALLAEIAYRQQEQRRLAAELRALTSRPIGISSRGKR